MSTSINDIFTKVKQRYRFFVFVLGLNASIAVTIVVALSLQQIVRLVGVNEVSNIVIFLFPILKVINFIVGSFMVGFLLLAVFLLSAIKRENVPLGDINSEQFWAISQAKRCGAVWLLLNLIIIPFDLAFTVGKPLVAVLNFETFWAAYWATTNGKVWVFTALFVLAASITAHFALTWGSGFLALVFSYSAFLPSVLTGHSAVKGSHDIATNNLFYHVFCSVTWFGGLVAITWYAMRFDKQISIALKRFSYIALVCLIVVGITGLTNAIISVDVIDWEHSIYGRLIITKLVLIILLTFFGYKMRKRIITQLDNNKIELFKINFIKLAIGELSLMAATFGVAVGLAQTPQPLNQSLINITQMEVVLGYKLNHPPTIANYLGSWRFDYIYSVLALVLLSFYMFAVFKLNYQKISWPKKNIIFWITGCLGLLFITSSGIGKYSPAVFSSHMLVHMILSMLIPVLLVQGAPITLFLRVLPIVQSLKNDANQSDSKNLIGPREWILLLIHSNYAKIVTHPAVATIMFITSFYILYFGGFYEMLAGDHAGHVFMYAHFLITGYIFYWVIIGIDPSPQKLSPVSKLALLIATVPFHALFGVLVMFNTNIIGSRYYNNLALPWQLDLLADQKLGGAIAWAFGEPITLLVFVVLAFQWWQQDRKEAVWEKKKAVFNEDAEFNAYNLMLKEINKIQ